MTGPFSSMELAGRSARSSPAVTLFAASFSSLAYIRKEGKPDCLKFSVILGMPSTITIALQWQNHLWLMKAYLTTHHISLMPSTHDIILPQAFVGGNRSEGIGKNDAKIINSVVFTCIKPNTGLSYRGPYYSFSHGATEPSYQTLFTPAIHSCWLAGSILGRTHQQITGPTLYIPPMTYFKSTLSIILSRHL